MIANPYESPATVARHPRSPAAAFAGRLCAIVSWSLLLLVAVGLGVLYSEGRVGLLAKPQYAGLFALAFLAGAPAALFPMNPIVRLAAILLSVTNFSIWMIYVAPLLLHPRMDALGGLALGAGVLCFSIAIAILALLAPNARDVDAAKSQAIT